MPESTPGFLCCSLLAGELKLVLRRLGVSGSAQVFFPSACHTSRGRGPWPPPEARALLDQESAVLAVCMNCRGPVEHGVSQQPISSLAHPQLQRIAVETQGELFLGRDATERALFEGAFLVLPGWLRCWRAIVVDSWGFDEHTAPGFFAESATRLLFLDTGVGGPWEHDLAAMAAFVGLPYEVRYVGVSHLEALVASGLSQIRQRGDRADAQRALARTRAVAAEHATVVDFINTLGHLPSEGAIIASLEDTIRMLFAARLVAFEHPDQPADTELDASSFDVEMAYGGRALGRLAVRGLELPQHRDRYLPMAGAVCDAAAIAVNASRLLELERVMARQLAGKVGELERSNLELELFARAVSHDLRQPLHVIAGYAELLATSYQQVLDERAQQMMGKIVHGVERMNAMIEDLLGLARIDAGGERVIDVDCAVIVRAVVADLGLRIAQTGARIELGELPVVRGRGGHLEQLFRNLLGNALKFTSDCPPVIAVRCVPQGESWHFVVSDNGVGVPPEQRESIFEPFRRGHHSERYQGTGIGLALCWKIVQQHTGRIWFEPAQPSGSEFHFTLARSVDSAVV